MLTSVYLKQNSENKWFVFVFKGSRNTYGQHLARLERPAFGQEPQVARVSVQHASLEIRNLFK
jgi:hypothetical protein